MKSCCPGFIRLAIVVVLIAVAAQLLAQNADAEKDKTAPQTSAPDKQQNPTELTSRKSSAGADPYLIGTQDVLQVEVWNEKELSGTVPVRPDGKISLPLLDDVQAAGLTAMQLSGDITEKLKKYVSDPKVTVVVEQVNSRQVYVLGE